MSFIQIITKLLNYGGWFMNRGWLVAVLCVADDVSVFGQGTISLNTATGDRPRVTIYGANVEASDVIWIQILVHGASSLSGSGAAPFLLTLGGRNAGLFSKGILTVNGIPGGTKVEVTILAWQDGPWTDFYHSSVTAWQSFSVVLGGVVDANGILGLPAPIVPGFKGMSLGLLPGWEESPSTIFAPLGYNNYTQLGYIPILRSVSAFDMNQDSAVDFLVQAVDYHLPVTQPGVPPPGPLVASQVYLAPAWTTRGWRFLGRGQYSGPNAIPVNGTNRIRVSYVDYWTPRGGWIQLNGTNLIDYGFDPSPGATPFEPGPPRPKPAQRFTFEVAQAAGALSGESVPILRRNLEPWPNGEVRGVVLVASPGEFLVRGGEWGSDLVKFASGEPIYLTGDLSWRDTPGWGGLRVKDGLESTLDGRRPAPWNDEREGYVWFRDLTTNWIHLSGDDFPHRLGSGASGVAGAQGDQATTGAYLRDGGVWESYSLQTSRTLLDLNRDGYMDYVLAKTKASHLANARYEDISLEPIGGSGSLISLGGMDSHGPGAPASWGIFAGASRTTAVHIPTAIGVLAGEITVDDLSSLAVSTRYEPTPGVELVVRRPASVALNLWRLPHGGHRLTWPQEHSAFALEKQGTGLDGSWTVVPDASTGTYELPLGISDGLYRLRRP